MRQGLNGVVSADNRLFLEGYRQTVEKLKLEITCPKRQIYNVEGHRKYAYIILIFCQSGESEMIKIATYLSVLNHFRGV